MIDIHCHLLPAIDDGAKNMDEALALINLAVFDGIERIVVTPHLHFGRFNNTLPVIQSAFSDLKKEVERANISIGLAYAAEIRFDSEILTLLESHNLPMFGHFNGQQFILLEFPHSHIPAASDILIKYLLKRDIVPVIAHPERNRDLLACPDKITLYSRLGCWFQVTANSITGGFGEACQTLALDYIDQGFIQIVASDAHNLKRRPPILSEARTKVAAIFGENKAQELFYDNPNNITSSMFEV